MSGTVPSRRTSVPYPGVVSALLVLFIALLFAPAAHAQKDYEEWRKQQQQQYQQYLNEQDKAFLKFLKKQWKNVDVEDQVGSPIDDKPEEVPSVEDAEEDPGTAESQSQSAAPNPPEPPSQDESADEPEPAPEPDPEPAPAESNVEEREQPDPAPQPTPSNQPPSGSQSQANPNMSQASLSFFGVSTIVPYTSAVLPTMEGSPGKDAIGDFWGALASEEYSPTLDALQQRRKDLGLSDWGYYVYVRDLGEQLYQRKGRSEGSNDATLWTWFMMIKSGYSVRVGYRDENVFLMLPVDGQIFNRPQLQLNGQRYYLMVEGGGGSLRTYEGQHESAEQVLTLDEAVLPQLGESTESRSASFSYDDERYNIEYSYNTAVLEYLRAYPNVELSVLFRSGGSDAAEASLTNALQPHVEDRSARDALNFLLRFAQFSTKYKRDRENFGEERFLFPEETLAESASDCEDRAVLYAYLVRTLLDRKLVGLKWPGHVATALKAGDGLEVSSDDRTLTVDGQTYILADPTYIGSSIGMEMPFVEGKKPDIIYF